MTFTSRSTYTFLLCFLSAPLFSMEPTNSITCTAKPVINGYIIPLSIYYTSQKNHDEINQIGNFGSNMYTPVVEVDAYATTPSRQGMHPWTRLEPTQIKDFENRTSLDAEQTERTPKLFPRIIPITCFYNAQQGTLLKLNVHGYETNLICCTHEKMYATTEGNGCFKPTFEKLQRLFLGYPSTTFCEKEEDNLLVQKEVIGYSSDNVCRFKHGARGYVQNRQLMSVDSPLKVILPYIMDENALLVLQTVRAIEGK